MLALLSISNLRMIGFAALGVIVLGFAGSWYLRGQAINRLEADNLRLTVELQTTETLLTQAREASARLGLRLQEREAARAGIGRVTEGIARATSDQDGPVAPVLRDALGGIGRLRVAPTSDAPRGP